MSTAELKLDLHKMIEGISDNTTLNAVYAFLSGNKDLPKSDWANNLSSDEVSSILKGLEDEAKGNVKTQNQIREKHRKQFPHLNL